MNESKELSPTVNIREREWVRNYNDVMDAIGIAADIAYNFNESLVPDILIEHKSLNINWFKSSWFDAISLFPEQKRKFDTDYYGLPYNLNPMPAWFLQQQNHATESTRFHKSRFIYTGLLLCRSSELVQFKQTMIDKHDNNGQTGNIKYRVLSDTTMKEPRLIKELLIDFANNNSISIPLHHSPRSNV